MSVYSKFLSLINGVPRTVDLSTNTLSAQGLQLNAATGGGSITQLAHASTTSYTVSWPAAQAAGSGYALINDGTGNLSWTPASAGSVTSVALADGSSSPIYTISGSPVTSTGTLTFSLNTQSANMVFAGPASGSAAQPTFRALVSADIPNNAANTTGTASNVTATSNATLTTLSALTTASSLSSVGTITSGTWNGSVIGPIYGGTGIASYATGDTLYASATNVLSKLPVGTTGQVLTVAGGIPSWASPATSGTVTSVALTVPSFLSVSGSPITSSGTLAVTLTTESANTVFAGPTSGGAATPTFRALVSADIPSLSSLYLPLTGGTMSGAINMGANQINNMADPTSAQDAATKAYVDASINGLTWKGPVQAYAASNVPLTGSTPLVIDGYTVQNGDLILLAGQTTASQDGEYAVAITGGSYTLTANGQPSAKGDAWLVMNGTLYGNSAFVATSAVPTATFVEFAGPNAYVFTAPLTLSGNTVSITQATTSTNGYLSSTDWNTFNNKQPAGNYITALTGDATASGPGSAALTLATVNSNIGTFASVTVNAKGLVTAAAALSGDATTSGSVLTLATVNGNVGSFGSSTSIPSFTVNAKGLITAASGNAVVAPAGTLTGTTLNSTVVSSSLTSVGTITSGTWNGTTIAIANGGTAGTTKQSAFDNLSPLGTAGDTLYYNGTHNVALGIGSTGQVLTVVAGEPAWAAPSISPSSIALTQNHILVGNASNLAADVAMSGDVAIVASGATTIQPGVVTASKLATVTDGITADQNGAGSTIEVLASPSLKRIVVAGQTFTANTSYAVRWGLTANGETSNRVYGCDTTTSSFDLFYCIGMVSSGTTVNAGSNITLTTVGSFALSSSDSAFASGTDGAPVFISTSGAFTTTPPSASGTAITRIGIVRARSATVTSNIIDVFPVAVGVN